MSNPLVDALDESAAALAQAKVPPANPPQPTSITAEGSSQHGWVRVRVVNARVTDCRVLDDALGLEPDEIGRALAQAVNAAMDDHDRQVVSALQAQQDTDLGALQRNLEEISRRAQRGMDEYLGQMKQLLDEASRRIKQ